MTRVDDLDPDRADKLCRMQEIKEQMLRLEAEYEDLREEVVIPPDEWDEPAFIVGVDGHKYRVSRVEGSDPVYHYDVLDELPRAVRDEITEVKIVGVKLKAAVEAERISARDALKLVTYKPKKPYPKFDLVE